MNSFVSQDSKVFLIDPTGTGEAALITRYQQMAFAKLKAGLRKAGERSVDQLWDRIGSLLETFTQQECGNYFRHAGYRANQNPS